MWFSVPTMCLPAVFLLACLAVGGEASDGIKRRIEDDPDLSQVGNYSIMVKDVKKQSCVSNSIFTRQSSVTFGCVRLGLFS